MIEHARDIRKPGTMPSGFASPRGRACARRWTRIGPTLCLALVLEAAPCRAVPAGPLLSIRSYSIDEGLPSAQVYQLVQDGSGRIWILSRAGITSYDGQAFEHQGARSGLPPAPYAALAVDERGLVLASDSAGRIHRFEDGRWRRLTAHVEVEPRGRVLALAAAAEAGRERFVLGTTNGLWLWDGGPWVRLDQGEAAPSSVFTTLSRLGDGLAVGTTAGLCRLKGQALECAWRGREPLLRDHVLAAATVRRDRRERLMLLTPRWLGELEEGRLRLLVEGLDADSGLAYEPASHRAAVGVDPTGTVFFGTPYRAYMLDPGARRPQELGPEQGLSGIGVTTILTDREGGTWLAGLRGLGRIGSRRFASLDTRAGLAEDEATAVAELPGGRFLVGHNSALTFLDGTRAEHVPLPELPRTDPAQPVRVLDLAVEKDGTAWAAVGLAVLEIRPDRQISVHAPDPRTASVELDARGRLFVLGERTLRVRQDGRFVEVPLGMPPSRLPGLRWLASDGRDRLFIATTRGLLWREGLAARDLDLAASWREARSEDGKGDDVFAALADRPGEVLVGTAAGLYRLVGQSLQRLAGRQELDRPVYLLLRDRAGRVWAGTDDGVFVGDGAGFRQLSVRHGLLGRETNRGAALLDARGRVWIGTDKGLSIYREAFDRRPAAPPSVEVKDIEVAGERYPGTEPLELSARPRALVFHATAIGFSREEAVLCRYRLDGFDDGWQGPAPLTPAGLRYTGIPPGSYRLRIAAGWGGEGPWGAEVQTAEIRIPAPLWQRPGAWILSALACGVVFAAAQQLRLWGLRRRNIELESWNAQLREAVAERQRLIGELEAKNGELERFTYTVSHDLKAPIVTIRGFLGFIEQDAVHGNLERVRVDIARIRAASETMSVLLDQLLELSRIGRVIGPRQTLPLAPLVREAARRAMRDGPVELVVAPDLPTVEGDRVRLLEVFENLIGNAVKFMGSQAAPRIEVGVRPGPEPVVYVADNGIGIGPDFQQKVFGLFERLDKRVEGTGVGLAIVKRIVEFHGGRIWVESEGAPGRGSRFCLVLPGPVPKQAPEP